MTAKFLHKRGSAVEKAKGRLTLSLLLVELKETSLAGYPAGRATIGPS